MDAKGKRSRFARAQERKKDAVRLAELNRLKQQVRDLKEQLCCVREPMEVRIQQLEAEVIALTGECSILKIKFDTKVSQVRSFGALSDKLRKENARLLGLLEGRVTVLESKPVEESKDVSVCESQES